MTRLLRMAAAVLLIVPLVGCGGGGGGSHATSGKLALTVVWPKRSRLIPSGALSIRAVLTRGTTVLGTQILQAGEGFGSSQTVFFTDLAPGPVVLTASAYPSGDGTGTAQATGSAPATIIGGGTAQVTVTMATTIDHLEISPANPTVQAGGNVQLTATAKDAQGNVVLVGSGVIQWTSGNPDAASVGADTGTVVGVGAGTSQITVTDTEANKTATTNVTVTAVQASATLPTRLALEPNGGHLYVLDTAQPQVSQFIVGDSGLLTPLSPPAQSTGSTGYDIATASVQGSSYVYVSLPEVNRIAQYRVMPGGPIQPLGPATVAATEDQPEGLAVDPNGQFLYVAYGTHANGSSFIGAYKINVDGTLTPATGAPLAVGFQIHDLTVSPNAEFLFSSQNVNGGDEAIYVFRPNPDGSVVKVGTAGGHSFLTAMAVNPTSTTLYAALQTTGSQNVQAFHIENSGALTAVGAPISTPPVFGIAVTPNSQFVYVTTLQQNQTTVLQYRANADGSLTPLSPATVDAGAGPMGVRVTPDGRFVYITNNHGGTVSQFRVNADGTLTPLSPAAVPG